MGQYYHTVIVPEENEEHEIYEVSNNCDFRLGFIGMKLMEHYLKILQNILYILRRNKNGCNEFS